MCKEVHTLYISPATDNTAYTRQDPILEKNFSTYLDMTDYAYNRYLLEWRRLRDQGRLHKDEAEPYSKDEFLSAMRNYHCFILLRDYSSLWFHFASSYKNC